MSGNKCKIYIFCIINNNKLCYYCYGAKSDVWWKKHNKQSHSESLALCPTLLHKYNLLYFQIEWGGDSGRHMLKVPSKWWWNHISLQIWTFFLPTLRGAQPIMGGSVKPGGELGPPNEIESYAPALLYCARMHFWKDSSGIFLNSFRNLNVKQTSLRILLAIRHKSFNKIPNSQHQWRRHGGGAIGATCPPPPTSDRTPREIDAFPRRFSCLKKWEGGRFTGLAPTSYTLKKTYTPKGVLFGSVEISTKLCPGVNV